MAMWFLGTSAAEFIGGLIAALAGTATAGGQVLDPGLALRTSLKVFGTIGWVAVAFGAVFLLLAPVIRHWAHPVGDPGAPPQPEPIAPTLDGERQAVNPAAIRADR
jgi:POT family proton-dependent oligopeptide transporter